jgi:hypothetical protein
MAFGIGITAPGVTGWRLREYWSKFSRFERAPSMVALDIYPGNYRCSLGTNTVLGLVTNGLFAVSRAGGPEN